MSDLVQWAENVAPQEHGLLAARLGYEFTIAADGTIAALTSGDQGYDFTHINIPREDILALVEDWPEFASLRAQIAALQAQLAEALDDAAKLVPVVDDIRHMSLNAVETLLAERRCAIRALKGE